MLVRFVYAKTFIDVEFFETLENEDKISKEKMKEIHSLWKDKLDSNKQIDLEDTLTSILDEQDIGYRIVEPDLVFK